MTHSKTANTRQAVLVIALLLALIALALPTANSYAAGNDNALQPFRAEYIVENDYVTGGKATLSLTPNENGGYDFALQSKPTGVFKWSKNGKIREHAVLQSLTPPFESSRYLYADKGRPERSYEIKLDRQSDELELIRGNDSTVHKLPADVFDRLSVTLALLHQVQTNNEFELLQVQVLDGHLAETVSYSNHGSETVQTRLGEFTANRILKDRINSNRETMIWVAQIGPSNTVLPLKIEQYKRGKLKLRLTIDTFSTVD